MGVGSNPSLEICQLSQSGHQRLLLKGQQGMHESRPRGQVDVPRTLGFGRAWPSLELLAVKGEHVFLVSSDQDDRRSEVLGQCLQPGHVQRARTLPLPPYGQGAATQEEEAGEQLPSGLPPTAQLMVCFLNSNSVE